MSLSKLIKEKKNLLLISGLLCFALISLVYDLFFNCPLEFEIYDDGWYRIIEETEIDTHMGTSQTYYIKKDGPFTKEEVNDMLRDCKKK